jgi:hypothetical protein
MKLTTIMGALLLAPISHAGELSPFGTLTYPRVDTNPVAAPTEETELSETIWLPSDGRPEPYRFDRDLRFNYRPTDFVSDHGQYRPGHW